MTMLKPSKKTLAEEEDFKKKIEELGRRVHNLPTSQLLRIASEKEGLHPKDTFIVKRWAGLLKYFKNSIAMEGEYDFTSMEVVYHELRSEISIYVLNEKKREERLAIPGRKFPSFVFHEVARSAKRRYQKASEKRTEVEYIDDYNPESTNKNSFVSDPRSNNPNLIVFEGKEYILINGVAQMVGVSPETLRRWDRRGELEFVHLNYKPFASTMKDPFLRAVPVEEFTDFVKKARTLKNPQPSPGYVSTKEALKRLGIHHTTLTKRRDAGEIKYEKLKNKYYYLV